jgi:hypothetical protein
MYCDPAKRRVEFEDSLLIKSSFITKDEMETCQLTRTKIKKLKKLLYHPQIQVQSRLSLLKAELSKAPMSCPTPSSTSSPSGSLPSLRNVEGL